VIRAKAAPRNVETLIANLNVRLRPERLDTDFGDVPLREILLRICRNLGVPEEWARQWGDDPEDAKPADAPAPIHTTAPTETAEPIQSAGPSEAKPSPQRRQSTPPPPWTVPGKPPVAATATALALCLAAPGTGPPRRFGER
jgi:hypothetical protein